MGAAQITHPLTETHMKEYRVAEIFGPTIQGEGIDVGVPCYFVRLGGCDFRCVWCDSMHAVDPALVRELPKMSPLVIADKLALLPGGYERIIFSGGNPALYDLEPVFKAIMSRSPRNWRFCIETQGTVIPTWLDWVDTCVISPKPPSSKMVHKIEQLQAFYDAAFTNARATCVKVVAFDRNDLAFAGHIARKLNLREIWISVGTNKDDTSETLLERYRLIANMCLNDFSSSKINFHVMPQMHVLLWGHKLGV